MPAIYMQLDNQPWPVVVLTMAFLVMCVFMAAVIALWGIGALISSYRDPSGFRTEFRPLLILAVIVALIIVGSFFWGIYISFRPLFDR